MAAKLRESQFRKHQFGIGKCTSQLIALTLD
jgi:hypothetical protein